MIEVDGSLGEGGGQVLRSALTLSVLTGRPIHVIRIRARRQKPGLQPQHLAAVRAAAAISDAHITGAALGSGEVTFVPGSIRSADYSFDIGTAGCTSLVLQTIFLPLALGREGAGPAGATSHVTLLGGTHVAWSPSFHFLDLHWMPMLRRMGFDADLAMTLAGFYPQGNGEVHADIRPPRSIRPLDLPERGALKGIRGISAVANLDLRIAERQRDQALRRLKGRHSRIEIELTELPSRTKGTFLLLLAEFKFGAACYVSLGALGKRAEQVADEACLSLERFLACSGAVDEYLADQLLLPLAFAEDRSRFRTARVTEHLRTNAEVIRAFGIAAIEVSPEHDGAGKVIVVPAGRRPG